MSGLPQLRPRRLGQLRYSVAFWLTLARFPPGSAVVRAGQHEFAGRIVNVTLANGQFFGGGLNIAPRASVQDGLLDVQIFQAPRTAAFAVMPRLLWGAHLTHRAVRRYVVDAVTVDGPAAWPVEADGEQIGTGSIRARLLPRALRFKI